MTNEALANILAIPGLPWLVVVRTAREHGVSNNATRTAIELAVRRL